MGVNHVIITTLLCHVSPSILKVIVEWGFSNPTQTLPKSSEKLAPHCNWDCTIDILEGTMPPRGHTYPLSLPESKAVEDYIADELT